jgi:hypothetical protein
VRNYLIPFITHTTKTMKNYFDDSYKNVSLYIYMNFRIYTKKMKVEKKGKFNYHSSNINVIDEANICASKNKCNGSPRTNYRIKIKVCKL